MTPEIKAALLKRCEEINILFSVEKTNPFHQMDLKTLLVGAETENAKFLPIITELLEVIEAQTDEIDSAVYNQEREAGYNTCV